LALLLPLLPLPPLLLQQQHLLPHQVIHPLRHFLQSGVLVC